MIVLQVQLLYGVCLSEFSLEVTKERSSVESIVSVAVETRNRNSIRLGH